MNNQKMYKELDKYKTGKKEKRTFVFPDKQTSEFYVDIYNFPLGELIHDFIEHEKKPRWKRRYYHTHLTEMYKEILNNTIFRMGY